jgi:hypothetical protein
VCLYPAGIPSTMIPAQRGDDGEAALIALTQWQEMRDIAE